MRPPPQENKVTELLLPEAMDELAFMEHILEQLLTGQRQSQIRFREEEREAMEEEHIGEDVARYPFLY